MWFSDRVGECFNRFVGEEMRILLQTVCRVIDVNLCEV